MPVRVAFAGADGVTGYVDLTTLTPEQDEALASWLADPSAPKVLHDAKEQLQALSTRGLTLAGITSDTALAAYLVRPDQRSYDLEDLVVRHLGRELKAQEAAGEQGMLDFAPDDDTSEREAMVRARAVLELSEVLGERLEETGGTDLLRDLELPLVDILARMERTGIAVDEDALTALEADFAAKMRQAQLDAYEAIGRDDVNLGSPKQLQEVLFDQLGMPKTKRTKTGYTTDADALADLFAKTEHPFLEALLRHRDTSRLRVTVEGLIKSVAPTGASTRPTSRPSPPPGGSARPTRTCRTCRSAPRRAPHPRRLRRR
jgi:DNA polymerase-1